MDGSNTRQKQGRDFGMLNFAGYGFDPLQVGVRTKTIVKAGSLQTITVRHLDTIYFGLIQSACDTTHIINTVLVTDCVATVTQGDIRNIKFFLCVHTDTHHTLRMDCAIRSAVAKAAEVIISKLP